MNVIALGTSGTYPRFMKACSGFLFADDPTFVLVDLGPGVLGNLFRYLDPFSLSAIVITHLHADHVLDIYPLRYYLQYNGGEAERKIPVYAEERAPDVLHGFSPGADSSRFLEQVFEFRPVVEPEKDTGMKIIGSLNFYFMKTRHIIPTYAVRCETPEGKVIGYTSDTSYDERLVEFFKNCDVLICEAAYQGERGKDYLHMSAREAGLFARQASAKRLYLTHIWPELDPSVSKREAEETFGKSVCVLRDHMIIEI